MHIFQQLRDKRQKNQPSALVTFLAIFNSAYKIFFYRNTIKKTWKIGI